MKLYLKSKCFQLKMDNITIYHIINVLNEYNYDYPVKFIVFTNKFPILLKLDLESTLKDVKSNIYKGIQASVKTKLRAQSYEIFNC